MDWKIYEDIARQWLVENKGYDPEVKGDRLDDEAISHAEFAEYIMTINRPDRY
jgi:hypothetical protein